MTSIQFWNVGAQQATIIPFSGGVISAHLLADWMPNTPAALANSFLGWPQFLTEAAYLDGTDFLSLNAQARGSERQWTGVLSWMLGVAGTREFLAREGYTWVAPLSAFYANNAQSVTLPANPPTPVGALTAASNPAVQSRLRPDYVAIRPTAGGGMDWAIVEAKGTGASLTGGNCPPAWRAQARNALLTRAGQPIQVGRNIVVATRSNPNAVTPRARRVQLRAWNSDAPVPSPSTAAAVEVVATSMFSLCMKLGLVSNAKALSAAACTRNESCVSRQITSDRAALIDEAAHEFDALGTTTWQAPEAQQDVLWVRETDEITFKVQIAAPTVRLIGALTRSDDARSAAEAVLHANKQLLGHRYESETHESGDTRISLPQGLAITVHPHHAS